MRAGASRTEVSQRLQRDPASPAGEAPLSSYRTRKSQTRIVRARPALIIEQKEPGLRSGRQAETPHFKI